MKAIKWNIRNLSLTLGVQLMLLATGSACAQSAGDAEPFSQAELDQMLAPIALYPDTVLSHLLIAATYPLEVVMAERWTRDNPALEGEAAVQAAEDEDWDPSVKALVAFPDLLRRMSEDLDWTENLGEAFLTDEEQVLDSVQDLRQRAYATGKLKDLEHLTVSRDEDRQIVIEPVVREVVYIPYYDTRVVYGPWWWADHQPRYWHDHRHTHSHWVHWGPRVHISGHFFFSAFHWDHRRVVVIDRSYRYREPLYRSRYIVRHQHARNWQHNPQHRRGVQYRNPRTRDFFERKHRERGNGSHYQRSVRGDSKPAQLQRRSSQEAVKRQLNRDHDRATRETRASRLGTDKSASQQKARDRQGTQAKGSQSRNARSTDTFSLDRRAKQNQARERAAKQQSVRPSTGSAARELRDKNLSGQIQRRESASQPKARAGSGRMTGQGSSRAGRQSSAAKRSHLKNERSR